jgi:malonyl-CoA O-methyltransferase
VINKKIVRKHFNRSAKSYEKAGVLQREIADRVLSRLDLMKINPKRILDCGARDGYTTQFLRKRYPKAEIIACDLSIELLKLKKRGLFKRKKPVIVVDYETLPFKTHSFDLIFSNLSLHWCSDVIKLIQQFNSMLKPNGLLLLTTMGPDTLKELRGHFNLHQFIDMHDIGDMLLKAGFSDPVMDMEYLTLHYDSINRLFEDLKQTGTNAALKNQSKGLYGKKSWQEKIHQFEKSHRLRSGKIPATVEIIYGHAWKSLLQKKSENNEVVVPIAQIKKA